ncbi:MAG: mechanosensitive ion channel family protein [Verrucomicrobia bacterium]|jgi:small-conductance mechanosensitive channel|nr:mechanosensitive ion channel family protein [Verrucomicrobiota bacterium]
MQDLLAKELCGNTVQAWLTALGITLAVWFALLLARRGAAGSVKRLVQKTSLAWDDVLAALIPKTHSLFLLALAVMAGSRPLALPERLDHIMKQSLVVIALVQAGLWATSVVGFLVQTHRERKLKEDPASVTTIGVVGLLARILVWILAALLVLANAGVEIGPLIAGLGVGGIAIALAVQTVLKDLLASLSIMLDKPFVVGDALTVDDLSGSVEHIGLKTTRIRSLSGEQLIFSNNDLLESRIRNFGRMRERRVMFSLGVTYQTPREKLAKIPDLIRAAIEAQPQVRFDRSHFKEYGSFSLNYETVYYVTVPDYLTHMNLQQAIHLHIHESFEREGIEFAYPTQTIFMAGGNPGGAPALKPT